MKKTSRSLVLWIVLSFLWFLLVALSWSSNPYWQDSETYLKHLTQGQFVAHPSGHLSFMTIAQILHLVIPSPYRSLQLATTILSIASFVAMALLLYRATANSSITTQLTISFAFNWVVLLITQIGTSHSSDLLTVALLLLTSLPFLQSTKPRLPCYLMLALAIILLGSFRLSTLIFHIPLLLFILLYQYLFPKDKAQKIHSTLFIAATYLFAAIITFAIQLLVIHLSGGWKPYSEYAASMHEVNRPSSILLSGISSTTLLNIFRALLWYALAAGPILLLTFFIRRKTLEDSIFLSGVISSGSVLVLCAIYICPHPGYFAAALPGLFLAAAKILQNKTHKPQSNLIRWIPTSAAVFGMLLFVTLNPISKPSSPQQAALNSLLLQYGLSAARQSIFYNTSEWLIIAGYEHLVPPHRVEEIKRHGRYLPPKPQ